MNLIFPPVGYVYIGALRTAVAFVVLVVLAGAVALFWTFQHPPGLYAFANARGLAGGVGLLGVAVHLIAAAHAALIAPRGRMPRRSWRLGLAAAALWLAPLLIAVLFRAYAPIAVYASASASMEPSLAQGDLIAVHGARALCHGANPRPGDVVIYRRKGQYWVKRVVAVAGQTVQLRGGRLIIDGAPTGLTPTGGSFRSQWAPQSVVLRETLPDGASYTIGDSGSDGDLDDTGVVPVPPGSVFVLGDNRDNSVDSRIDGPLRRSDICGIAFEVLQAKDPARIGKRP